MRLIHGDCVNLREYLEPDSIDLTVTSPPYDNLRSYNGMGWNQFSSIATQLFVITKPGGVVVWVVGDQTVKGSETGMSFEQALYFKKNGFNLHDTMIYRKQGFPFPETNRYYPVFEYMFIFSKGKPKTVNLIKDRQNKCAGKRNSSTQRERDGTLRKHSGHGKKIYAPFGVRYNVWDIGSGFNKTTQDKFAYEHPAMFPEALARDHIITWSNPGDVVLDPFMGAGTTGKMAMHLERDFVGIEIDPKYFELAKRRIK